MIKKLRLKFIFTACFAYLLVLLCVEGGIIAWSYSSVVKNADKTLSIIVENDGKNPVESTPREFEAGNERQPEPPKNGGEHGTFSPETRFFTVKADENGVYTAIVDKIDAVNQSQAVDYAKAVFDLKKSNGFYGVYRYLKTENGGLKTVVFLDTSREIYSCRNFAAISLLIGGCSLVVVVVLVFLFSWLAFRPIAENYAKQKRFITDANHELKTPLTVIGADCDVLELQTGKNEWIDNVRGQVKKLTDLTEKLVMLSRAEEENPRVIFSDFSISEVASDAVKPYEAVAVSQSKVFKTDIARGVTCHGNVEMIRRLFSLLLDNAFKYSDKNGEISLSLKQKGKNCEIIIKNTTDCVPRGNLDDLFERFYRPDSSRNSKTGGYGIGLSVARAIVNQHGGKIFAASADGKIITFTINLRSTK